MAEKKKADIKKVKQEEMLVEVSSTVLGKENKKAEKIKVRPFLTEAAHVGVSFGLSFQAPDESWQKINVFLNAPCYKEEMVDVFNQVSEMADSLMTQEYERITGGGNE